MDSFFNKNALKYSTHNENFNMFNTFKGPLYKTNKKLYSQNGEDGILYYIFSCIGYTNKKCIEICAGNGRECNTANLIKNHGFNGLLFDGNNSNVQIGLNFFKNDDVKFLCNWITRSNISGLIQKNNYGGDIDLLSLDIDGVDYWILKELIEKDIINPRVIVLEYQDIIGPEKRLTVPYADDFNGWTDFIPGGGPNYCGASLQAFISLLSNYTFIGSHEGGFNAFFIRKDIKSEYLHEETNLLENVFHFPGVQFGMNVRWNRVKDKHWVEV